jgi:hypothetical protein
MIAVALVSPVHGGDGKDEEIPGPDPYTREKPAAMKKAGYEAFGPLDITPTHTTADVIKLLGVEWMLWVETEHFRVGSTLNKRPVVRSDKESTERFDDELARLRKKIRIPRRLKELDEWLLLHLYAQRLEELYADLSDRFGVTEDTFPAPGDEEAIERTGLGPYMGNKEKFIVLLFEQKGNLARYLGRYMNAHRDTAYRGKYPDSENLVVATSRQDFGSYPDEDTAFFCHVTSAMVHVLTDGFRGYRYLLPMWWTEGLKHWYVRRIDPTKFLPTTAEGQKYDYRRDHEWEKKVYARIKNDYYRSAREILAITDPREMDFADHMMTWSRVDYLLTLGGEKTGVFMDVMNRLTWASANDKEKMLVQQEKALKEAWGLDPETLDERWTAWVLKNYRKGMRGR